MLVELVIMVCSITKSQICLLLVFSDSDWAGNVNDRKSTIGGYFYVGANLVAWMSKKQNFFSLSTVEAEYIAAGSCYHSFFG